MTTILPAVAAWQYQFGANTLPPPAIPVASWLNGVSPFGYVTLVQTRNPPRTEWAPNSALWMRRTVTLPEGSDFWLNIEIENACFVYWDGTLIGEANPSNVDVTPFGKLFVKLTTAQSSPGNHSLVLYCLDETADLGAADNAYVSVELIQPAVITQIAEDGVNEELSWETDLQTSFDGTETGQALLTNPQRTFLGSLGFATEAALRRHLAITFKESAELYFMPAFPYLINLKARADIGDNFVIANTTRSDFRVGSLAIVIENDAYEVFEVSAIAADSLTFTEDFVQNFSKRAVVCPLLRVYSPAPVSISRKNTDYDAVIEFRAIQYDPWAPFVAAENTEELTLFDTYPVLEQIPFGKAFDSTLQGGIIFEDSLSLPALFNPWNQSKVTIPLHFLCNRLWDNTTWLWWKVFLDYCQGIKNIFLLRTNRADLGVVTPAIGSGTTVTVEGHDYRTNYWGLDTFARIAIESDAGLHYASVTAAAASGDNDLLTFTPALPAGAGWDLNQKISFLLKARLATDKVVLEHYGLRTEIAFSIRTAS